MKKNKNKKRFKINKLFSYHISHLIILYKNEIILQYISLLFFN